MRKRIWKIIKFIFPILLICVLLYFLFLHFKIYVSKVPITTYQFYDLVIKIIAAILTLSAVIVALFKESLISAFRYVDLKIENRDHECIHEVINPAADPPVAESYETILKVSNIGNILAERCSIKVTDIKFKNNPDIETSIDVYESTPIVWNNQKEEIDIHSENYNSVTAITLSTDENLTVPGQNQGQNAKLIIGGIPIPNENTNGKFEVTFELQCSNHKVIKFKLFVAWNGEWRSRSSDIKGCYSVKITPEIIKPRVKRTRQ